MNVPAQTVQFEITDLQPTFLDYIQSQKDENTRTFNIQFLFEGDVLSLSGCTATATVTINNIMIEQELACAVDETNNYVTVVVNAFTGGGMKDAFDQINTVFSGAYYSGKYHARGYEIAVTAELNYESKTVQGLGLYDPVVLVTESGKEIKSKVNGVKFDALQEKIIKVELDNKPLTLQDMISKKRR